MPGEHLRKSSSDPGESRLHPLRHTRIYHVGVASCFQEYAPQLSMHKIAGSSVGALVAVAYICGDLQLAYATTDLLRVAAAARSRALGPLHPSFDINHLVREALERGLPDDVHLRVNGKLHVSLTRSYDLANVVISEFDSKEDVIQVLLCSCFIPFWSGVVWPKYKGITYLDGGFSNNLLILDDKTITVAPFAGEADVCPQDDTLNLLQIYLSNTSFSLSPNNLYRLSLALNAPPLEIMSSLCEQGFSDALRYLQRTKLISCNRCLAIRSSYIITTNSEDVTESFGKEDKIHLSESRSHVHLEQQEEMIEISGNRRRDSMVSITSQKYQQQQTISTTTSLEELEIDDDCNECSLIRQKALYDPLPKQFSDRISDACDAVNRSLSNWIYSHRPIKYLSYLAAPCFLPVDISSALMLRFLQRLPMMSSQLIALFNDILHLIFGVMKRFHSSSLTSTLLMSSSSESCWQQETIEFRDGLIRQQKQQSKQQVTRSSSFNAGSNITTTTTTTHKEARESSISVKILSETVRLSGHFELHTMDTMGQ